MLPDTPANRAEVNRTIAEAMGYRHHLTDGRNGRIYVYKTEKAKCPSIIDYTRSLDACLEVCEAKGIELLIMRTKEGCKASLLNPFIIDVAPDKASYIWGPLHGQWEGTDLRWLVAQAVAEAVKHES